MREMRQEGKGNEGQEGTSREWSSKQLPPQALESDATAPIELLHCAPTDVATVPMKPSRKWFPGSRAVAAMAISYRAGEIEAHLSRPAEANPRFKAHGKKGQVDVRAA
jgi:hypothetical protein